MPKDTKDTKKVTRGMPNNINAENAVLGSILIDDKAADLIIPTLKADDFYLAANRTIFAVMKTLQQESIPIDTVSVADELERIGKLDEIGSIAYLSELAEGIPSAANCEYYANIVRRDSLTRQVINIGNDIARYGYDSEDGEDALSFAEQKVYEVAEQSSPKALVHAGSALALAMKNIQDMQSGNVIQNIVFTGFPKFDSITHGLKPGEIVILAARPSVGKTAFALNIAANVAINYNKKVAVFSLEMPADLLARRLLAYVSRIPYSAMNKVGGLEAGNYYARLFKAYKTIISKGIYIDDFSMNTPADVLSKCRRLKRESGLDLVIIDYLQLMSAGSDVESRQVEVSAMSRKLKVYAKDLGVPIIVLSQMSRKIEDRNDHTPIMADLRESGGIEQDADVIMFLNNPSKYNNALPEDDVILDVKKNRNGEVCEIKLKWDKNTTSFMECEDQEGDSESSPQPSKHVDQKKIDKAFKKGAEEAGVTLNAEGEVEYKDSKPEAPKDTPKAEAHKKEEKNDSKLAPLEDAISGLEEVLGAQEMPFGDDAPEDEDIPLPDVPDPTDDDAPYVDDYDDVPPPSDGDIPF